MESFRSGTHILIIDHNLEALAYLTTMLNSLSYKVTIVNSGYEAFTKLRDVSQNIDLVLAEAYLTNDNWSFLIQTAAKREIPVLLMSHSEYSKASGEALQNGAYFYLQKPISIETIMDLWQYAMAGKIAQGNVNHKGKKILETTDYKKSFTLEQVASPSQQPSLNENSLRNNSGFNASVQNISAKNDAIRAFFENLELMSPGLGTTNTTTVHNGVDNGFVGTTSNMNEPVNNQIPEADGFQSFLLPFNSNHFGQPQDRTEFRKGANNP